MGAEAKQEGKVEEKEKKRLRENRKIATERVNKRVEKAETRLKKKVG